MGVALRVITYLPFSVTNTAGKSESLQIFANLCVSLPKIARKNCKIHQARKNKGRLRRPLFLGACGILEFLRAMFGKD